MFIRMYNYLKYYNNSSSFNFRNLFFVERSAKFRRIMSNVGSTFRNSKWTDYSLNNVNRLQHSFEPNTVFNISGFFAIFLLLSLVSLQEFSLLNLLMNLPLSVLNDHIDSWVYIIELWSTLHLVFVQFITWYGVQTLLTTTLSVLLNQSPKSMSSNPLSTFAQPTSFIEPIVQGNSEHLGLKEAFANTQVLSTSNDVSTSLYQVKENLGLEVRPEGFDLKQLDFLTGANPELSNSARLESFSECGQPVEGSFYLTSLSFQRLSNLTSQPELLNLSKNLTTQDQMINTLRWSYRYNNLHRRTMYNSHKLTEVKTLISAGYFDLSSTSSNVWFSDQYARNLDFGKKAKMLTSINLLKTNWNRLYSPSFGSRNLTGAFSSTRSSSSTDALTKLSFYETSFHFFLNRIKSFSSLRSTTLSSTPTLKGVAANQADVYTSTGDLYKHSLTNSLRLLPRGTSYLTPHLNQETSRELTSYSDDLKKVNDVTIVKKDVDVLYLKTLEIIYNLTKTNSANPNTLYTYVYLDSTLKGDNSGSRPRLANKVVNKLNIFKN